MSPGWPEYERWNAALASAMFGEFQNDLPAYIDTDDAALARWAEMLNVEASAVEAGLVAAVRGTLKFEPAGPADPLAEHTSRFHQWRRTRLSVTSNLEKRSNEAVEPPPFIGLLTICVIAATKMAADNQMVAHAYYPRLNELLGLDEAQGKKLRDHFPITELFWRALNDYLAVEEGRIGLPTAYALGHRYVGLPQSQALVRAGDRVKLPEFFRLFGLIPGSELIPADIERLFNVWVSRVPSPVSANLARLWNSSSARERISEVVATELSLWDGSSRSPSAVGSDEGDLRLTSMLRTGWGRTLEMSFSARFHGDFDVESVVIDSAPGEPKPRIGVVAGSTSRVSPIPGSKLDPNSLVGVKLELREPSSGHTVARTPRRIVPFRRDDLLGISIEVDKVQLAEDALLLVRNDERFVNHVLELLSQNGTHGAILRSTNDDPKDGVAGIPDGWILIEDVRIYAIAPDVKDLDLQTLVPQTTAQMSFSGGLKLPGPIRKWSSLRPPEIGVAVVGADTMTVTITDISDERLVLHEQSSESGADVIVLEELYLDDGDYEVELSVDGRPISVRTLRLRSSDTPDIVSWEGCSRLNYEFDGIPLAPLSAVVASDESSLIVDGLSTFGQVERDVTPVPVAAGSQWSAPKPSEERSRPVVVLGTVDTKSCVVTGAHYIELPMVQKGDKNVDGVCAKCGIRKTYPAKPKWKKHTPGPTRLEAHDFSALPKGDTSTLTWDDCIDGLIHVGGGSIPVLERIASQSDGSALFLDEFVRTLEGLGQIDVRRDDRLRPVEWEANPAYLAETNGKGFVLAGVWSRQSKHHLGRVVSSSGGELVEEASPGMPSSWYVRGLTAKTLDIIATANGLGVTVVEDALHRMVRALPPLSSVLAGLPEVPIPEYSRVQRFDLASASWVTVPGIAGPGAYRLEQSFRTISVWISPEGSLSRTARIASVQLVKHFAGLAAGKPLLGYLDTHKVLLAPMGADLPGLYGRVAMLSSGRPPTISRKTRSIGYCDVPRDVADRLNSLFAS